MMNVTFALGVPTTLANVEQECTVTVAYNDPTVIQHYDFNGGYLIGSSKSIVIQDADIDCVRDPCGTFVNNYTTLVNANISGEVQIQYGTVLKVSTYHKPVLSGH